MNLFDRFIIARSIYSGRLGYLPLRLSDRRDVEEFPVSYSHEENERTYFRREIPEHESLMLWRLFGGNFSEPEDIRRGSDAASRRRHFMRRHMVLCAPMSGRYISEIRFRYAEGEGTVVYPPPNEPYAVDFLFRKVFYLKGVQRDYWRTPERALRTIYTKPEWWQPWSEEDEAAAKAEMLRQLGS